MTAILVVNCLLVFAMDKICFNKQIILNEKKSPYFHILNKSLLHILSTVVLVVQLLSQYIHQGIKHHSTCICEYKPYSQWRKSSMITQGSRLLLNRLIFFWGGGVFGGGKILLSGWYTNVISYMSTKI